MGSKHVGAKSVTSVTAYVILYSYIQVHKLVQIKSISRWILKHIISDKVVYCNEIHIVRHLPTFSMESAIVKNVVPEKKKIKP